MKDTTQRHRNTGARGEFLLVSKALLFGAQGLSDGALLTYLAVASHDWWEPERGARKGYAFPSLRRLAQLRHTTARTIQRHLDELIKGGLIVRRVRPGKPSLLYVSDRFGGDQGLEAQGGKGDDIGVARPTTKTSSLKEGKRKMKSTLTRISTAPNAEVFKKAVSRELPGDPNKKEATRE